MAQEFSNTNTGGKPADPYKLANQDEVPIAEKIEDLSHFMSSCKFGMMTTRDSASGNLVSRCMALTAKETGGIDLLFHTNTESGKTDDLSSDPHVNMAFLNGSGEWASISGQAYIETDRELVKKHYSSALKAWVGDLGDGKHDGGPNDPRLGVIRLRMRTATYSLVSKNVLSRVADMAQGAVTGKPASVNKLREITVEEVEKWRETH